MKKKPLRQIIHAVILVIGLVLMIGGIATGKHGATVVGIIISGVNVQQWLQWNKQQKTKDS